MRCTSIAILCIGGIACRLGFDYPAGTDDAGVAAADGAGFTADAGSGDGASSDALTADGASPDASAMSGFCGPGIADLVACYQFDGTGEDESGAGNHLAISGASFVPSISGTALRTQAGSQVLAQARPSLVVNELTIEMWVNPESLPGSGRMGLVDHDNQYSIFLLSGGRIRCGGLDFVYLDYPLPLNTWTHVACTSDPSGQAIWINGQPGPPGPPAALGVDGTAGMGIGQNSPANDNFRGAIDSVRIFGAARTPAEICAAAAPNC